MKYLRSRPWRSRGPWFSNRAGARRRGRRDDELVIAAPDEIQDGAWLAESPDTDTDVEVDEVLLPIATAWPVPQRILAAQLDQDRVLSLAPGTPNHDGAPRQISQVAEAIVAVDLLSLPSDADAGISSSRQSA